MLYKTILLQGQQPLEQTALIEWRLPGGASSKLVVFLHTGAEVKGAHLTYGIEPRGCGFGILRLQWFEGLGFAIWCSRLGCQGLQFRVWGLRCRGRKD